MKLCITVLERNMSHSFLITCKILILLYHLIWCILYKLYPADTINIHRTSFSTLRPRLITHTITLTCLVSTFIHINLINTLPFVMDLYDSISMTVKDLHFAFMTTFVWWVVQWSISHESEHVPIFLVYILTWVIIGGFVLFASCATFQPRKMTFIHSYIQVIPHLCIFITLQWVFHFIVFLHDVL